MKTLTRANKAESYKWFIIYSLLALFAFVVTLYGGMRNGLWRDELFVIHIAYMPFPDSFIYILDKEGNGALFDLLHWLWFRIMPFGDAWLLLLPELIGAVAVVSFAVLCRRIFGDVWGLVGAVALISQRFFLGYANELRAYSLCFLTVTIVTLLYLKRIEGVAFSLKNDILFGVAVFTMVFTFYLSIFISFFMFVTEVIYFVRRRMKNIRFIVAYLIAGALYIPYGLMQLKYSGLGVGWAAAPESILDFKTILHSLIQNRLYLSLFIFGLVTLLVHFFAKKTDDKTRIVINTSMALVVFCGINYIGSKYFNAHMWVDRYFMIVYPYFMLVIVFILNYIYEKVLAATENRIWKIAFLSAALCMLSYQGLSSYFNSPDLNFWEINFEETAEFFNTNRYILDENTGLLYLADYQETWARYCVEKKGINPPLKFTTPEIIGEREYDKVYVLSYLELSQDMVFPEQLTQNYDYAEQLNDLPLTVWVKKTPE